MNPQGCATAPNRTSADPTDQPLSLLPTPQSSTLQPPEGTALLTSCSYGMVCIFGCAYTLQSENPRSCPSASKKQMHHLGEKAMLPLASLPGVRKIGGSAWYTPFAHARSLLGNLHTVRYTNHALTKQSILVYLLTSHTAELCSLLDTFGGFLK